MEVSQEFVDLVKYVSNMLLYRVEATQVAEEFLHIPIKGMDDVPSVWSGQVTTYTLGLMLGGALSQLEA